MAYTGLKEGEGEKKTIHGIQAAIIGDIDFTNSTFDNLKAVLGIDTMTYEEAYAEPQKVFGSNGLHAEIPNEVGDEYTGELAAYDADLGTLEEGFYGSTRNANGTVQRSKNLTPKVLQFCSLVWNDDQGVNLPRLHVFYRCLPNGKNWEFSTDSDSITPGLNTIPLNLGTLSFIKNENEELTPWLILDYDDAPEWFDAHKYLTEIATPTTDFTITEG